MINERVDDALELGAGDSIPDGAMLGIVFSKGDGTPDGARLGMLLGAEDER